MLPPGLIVLMLVSVPALVFVHFGHASWTEATISSRFELIEASLVAVVLILYALSKAASAMKHILSRLWRNKPDS